MSYVGLGVDPISTIVAAASGCGTYDPAPDAVEKTRCKKQGTETVRDPHGGKTFCCPVSTFNNATYAKIVGGVSNYYLNERRVRAALEYLLSPTASGSSVLEEVAFDLDANIPQGLSSDIARAAANFNSQWPSSRWKTRQGCNETDCTVYGCWRGAIPVKGPASDVVMSVPGSYPGAPHRTLLNRSDWEGNQGLLLGAQNGQIVPTPWLKRFLEVFSPTVSSTTAVSPIALSLRPTRTVTTAVSPQTMMQLQPRREVTTTVSPAMIQQLRPGAATPKTEDIPVLPPDEGKPFPWTTVGIVAAAGVGAFLILWR